MKKKRTYKFPVKKSTMRWTNIEIPKNLYKIVERISKKNQFMYKPNPKVENQLRKKKPNKL